MVSLMASGHRRAEILSEPAQTIEGVAVGGGEAVELTLEPAA